MEAGLSFWRSDATVQPMSTKAQAILKEIQGLSPVEVRELHRQIVRMTMEFDTAISPATPVPQAEFDKALEQVTGCTAGKGGLERLLADRRRDRERDEAWLERRKQERTRG